MPPAVTRFAWRWWNTSAFNQLLGAVAVFGVIGSFFLEASLAWLGLLAVVGPIGLSWRGRSSKLAWTPRLIRLAGGTGILVAVFVAWSAFLAHPGPAVAAVVALPRLIDAAAALALPLERRLGDKWVAKARARLAESRARVVAITGSYGKTTTKGYVRHLLTGALATVGTPASFNNRMGLARAINEQLVAGTDVFVAEMGTYGAGEIADFVPLRPPEVAVITSIGPVHLERFGSEEAIVAAKSEILANAASPFSTSITRCLPNWPTQGLVCGIRGQVLGLRIGRRRSSRRRGCRSRGSRLVRSTVRFSDQPGLRRRRGSSARGFD